MPRIGELSLSGDVRIDGDLDFVGAQSITTTTASNLTLLPGAGGITIIGDAGTTSRSLANNDDLFISGKLEVDGYCYIDSQSFFADAARFNDTTALKFGSSSDVSIRWETGDANAQALIVAMPDGGGNEVPICIFGDQGIIGNDLGWFNGQTIPRIAMVAADEGGYFAFGVANDDELDIISTEAVVAENDETKFSHKYPVNINGALYYIMLTQT